MTDREKVIKGLECCAHGVAKCHICPYDPRNFALPVDCMTDLAKDALELLKEQGYRKASLAVQKANYAVKMYRAVGFKTVSENDEEYIMVCEL